MSLNLLSKIVTFDEFVHNMKLLPGIDDVGVLPRPLVTTNGCFDIIHAGHVAYLEKAAAFGKHMLVLVNSDDSVTRLKSFGRPFVELEYRMMVLAALESVNYVISFTDDTPEYVIECLYANGVGPSVHVKGGDYVVPEPFPVTQGTVTGCREEEKKKHYLGFPEAAIVHEYGGEVKVIPFEHNTSTSEIVNRIRTHEQNYYNQLSGPGASLADASKKE